MGLTGDGEFAFIERVRGLVGGSTPGERWIGDDTAVLDDGLLFATDALVDGVHFRLDWCDPADVGWKAVAVNVSDVAAMGGIPRAIVASIVASPGGGSTGIADQVMAGVVEAATAFRCPLVGGDTTSGPTLVVTVAIMGIVDEGAAVCRDGARSGDTVFVTGELGGATAALHDLVAGREPRPELAARLHRPTPRVAEGRAAADAGATAMIDISDGLAGDHGHIAEASQVGVRIEADRVPVAEGISLAEALVGGDDYELCFTAPDSDRVADVFREWGLAAPHPIGEITRSSSRELVLADGSTEPFPTKGYEHRVS